MFVLIWSLCSMQIYGDVYTIWGTTVQTQHGCFVLCDAKWEKAACEWLQVSVSKYQDIIKALEAVSPGSKCSTYDDSLKFLVFLYFYRKLVYIIRIISCVCVYIRGLYNDV